MEGDKLDLDVLTSTVEEKSDACDSTPTSSTDAFTTTSLQQVIATDDPISSTSSDVCDSNKTVDKHSTSIISTAQTSSVVSEKDMLDINITDTSTEKITENVDDIVQDLENLLGESTSSFDFPIIKPKETKKDITPSENTALEIDESLKEKEEATVEEIVENAELPPQESESNIPEETQRDNAVSDDKSGELQQFVDDTSDTKSNIPMEPLASSTVQKEEDGVNEQVEQEIVPPSPEPSTPITSTNPEKNADELVVPSTSDIVNVKEVEEMDCVSTDIKKVISSTPDIIQQSDDSSVSEEKEVQRDVVSSNVEISTGDVMISETTNADNINTSVDEIQSEITPLPFKTSSNSQNAEIIEELGNIQAKESDSELISQSSEVLPEILAPISDIQQTEIEEIRTPSTISGSEIIPSESDVVQTVEIDKQIGDVSKETVVDNSNLESEDISRNSNLESGDRSDNLITELISDCTAQTQDDECKETEQEMDQETVEICDITTADSSIKSEETRMVEEQLEIVQDEEIQEPTPVDEEIKKADMDEVIAELATTSNLETVENIFEKIEETTKSIEPSLEAADVVESQKSIPIVSGTDNTEPMETESVFVPLNSTIGEKQEVSIEAEHQPIVVPSSSEIGQKSDTESVENEEEAVMQTEKYEPEVVAPTLKIPEESGVLIHSDNPPENFPDSTEFESVNTIPIALNDENKPEDDKQDISGSSFVVPANFDDTSKIVEDEITETPSEIDSTRTVQQNDPEEVEIPLASEELSEIDPIKSLEDPGDSEFAPEATSAEVSPEIIESNSEKDKLKEPLIINIEDVEREKPYSPKIIIKPPIRPIDEEETEEKESMKGSLKMTITKQSNNTMHSILKIYNPEDQDNEEIVPKLIIKPIEQQPHSPKLSKKVFSPSSSSQRSSSPRITIKPIPKPDNIMESISPLKITIKPVLKPEKHSPKLTIKPIVKPDDEEPKLHSPRVTIKPIVKPPDENEVISPRITIKPIVKPDSEVVTVPPKITIKPIIKPQDCDDDGEDVKERIVLKINKGTLPSCGKELRLKAPPEEEKLAKIKLKFSREGGHPHIVQQEQKKRSSDSDYDNYKKMKFDLMDASGSSKLKEMLSGGHSKSHSDTVVTIDDDEEDDDDVRIVESIQQKSSPIVISEESNQDSINAMIEERDPLAGIPIFEITPESVKQLNPEPLALPVVEVVPTPPAPRKRGRPRKVPLQVREDFKDVKEEEPKPVVYESTRPKRSCRGQSVRTTLGIKPRKPRGPGRGRGSKRGMGTRTTPTPDSTPTKSVKETKLSAKARLMKEELLALNAHEVRSMDIDDGFLKSPLVLAPPSNESDRADIVMYEEETRMSAETNSRAQTPAKQVLSSGDLIEESQSSVQSTATTESVKIRKGPRLEVHQEPEGAVIAADQLAEYYWSGGGPYMLQEQVAQFLGIKSFKRKYPNIPRRVVDMQERDFIRESGLAGEAMCDLGLTAVNSADILDIMYSDFQDKYEEYCKHQRDRQAKDLTNKQKALSLAASQEKTKLDITQQAVQSAASWNANFNKTRRDQRKACMDLQTLTVHFPKGKMKQINKPKVGNYPVALVPGQFTDYYKEFTPTEINNLPLATLCYNSLVKGSVVEMDCDSQTDGSGSESDSSSSDSDSSYTGSSDENCTLCKPSLKRVPV